MYDAFRYFTRMAELVAKDSDPRQKVTVAHEARSGPTVTAPGIAGRGGEGRRDSSSVPPGAGGPSLVRMFCTLLGITEGRVGG